jgi:hypothetical protein
MILVLYVFTHANLVQLLKSFRQVEVVKREFWVWLKIWIKRFGLWFELAWGWSFEKVMIIYLAWNLIMVKLFYKMLKGSDRWVFDLKDHYGVLFKFLCSYFMVSSFYCFKAHNICYSLGLFTWFYNQVFVLHFINK